jgi:hypothetical protein
MNMIKRALVATSVAAAGVTAFAGTGSATFTQLDHVRIEADGYVLGGDGDGHATVLWNETGEGVEPYFSGKLHLNDVAGQCARVRMISYDLNDNEIGDRQFAPSDDEEALCASGSGHVAREVSLQGPDDVHSVELTIQSWIEEPSGGHWNNEESVDVVYGPELPPSDVLVDAGKFDLGAGTLVNGVPSEPARLTWDVSTGWKIDATISGTLFVRNARNQELRVVATCYDAAGDPLPGETAGEFTELYPETNGPEEFEIERRPCGAADVAEVGVTIELMDVATDTWEIRGEQRIPLPSVFPDIQIPEFDLDPLGR